MVLDDVQRKVLDTIQRYRLVPEACSGGERIVLVGVSGGPDSVCLLHALNDIKALLVFRLHAAHFNHMLRGSASDEDARYVADLCDSLGIEVTFGKSDVETYRKEHRISIEEAARRLRYGFFSEVVRSTKASCVALGHTQDDQVETILLHLIRGTGTMGLRGMRPATEWHSEDGTVLRVVRPLLEITRKDTEKYCRARGLSPRSDASNYSPEYVRNRVRHDLIPSLRAYNKNITEAVLRTAHAANDDVSFIEAEVTKIWDDIVQEQPNGLLIDTEALLSCYTAIQKHLLRRAVEKIQGDLVDVHAIHVEKMLEALSKPAGKSIHLPRGLRFHVGYNYCLLSTDEIEPCPFPELAGESRLKVPGYTELPGWKVSAEIVEPGYEHCSGFKACLDIGESGTDLLVRSRNPGDRFQPLGMDVVKKLQDFMVDARIPRSWRFRVPLVCSPQGIIWVVGWRVAEWAKVTDTTTRVLKLEFELT